MKQHYVPEVYLKNFAFNQVDDVFQLRLFPTSYKRSIKSINKSGVCYEKDMLTFQTSEILRLGDYKDKYAVEDWRDCK